MASARSHDDLSPLLGSSPARGAMSSAASRPRPSTSSEAEPSKTLRARTVSVTSMQDEDDLGLVCLNFAATVDLNNGLLNYPIAEWSTIQDIT